MVENLRGNIPAAMFNRKELAITYYLIGIGHIEPVVTIAGLLQNASANRLDIATAH